MQKLVWQNSNGDVIDLTSGNYGITEWEGFSNTSLNIQSQQVPFQDGGVFLDALIEQRELSVTLKMQDNGNLEERYRMRRELIHALNPKLGEGYLIYTNDFISKRIKCVAQVPLFETHNSDTRGTPKASLAWTACEPYWEDLEETNVYTIAESQKLEIEQEGDVETSVNIELVSDNISNLKIGDLEIQDLPQYAKISTAKGNKSAYSQILDKETILYNNEIRCSAKIDDYNYCLGGIKSFIIYNVLTNQCKSVLIDYGKYVEDVIKVGNNLYAITTDIDLKPLEYTDYIYEGRTGSNSYILKSVDNGDSWSKVAEFINETSHRRGLIKIKYNDGKFYLLNVCRYNDNLSNNFELYETEDFTTIITHTFTMYCALDFYIDDNICIIIGGDSSGGRFLDQAIYSNNLTDWSDLTIHHNSQYADNHRMLTNIIKCNGKFLIFTSHSTGSDALSWVYPIFYSTDGIEYDYTYFDTDYYRDTKGVFYDSENNIILSLVYYDSSMRVLLLDATTLTKTSLYKCAFQSAICDNLLFGKDIQRVISYKGVETLFTLNQINYDISDVFYIGKVKGKYFIVSNSSSAYIYYGDYNSLSRSSFTFNVNHIDTIFEAGEKIYFHSTDYLYSYDGQSLRTNDFIDSSDGSVRAVTFNGKKIYVYTHNYQTNVNKIYVYNPITKEKTIYTNTNRDVASKIYYINEDKVVLYYKSVLYVAEKGFDGEFTLNHETKTFNGSIGLASNIYVNLNNDNGWRFSIYSPLYNLYFFKVGTTPKIYYSQDGISWKEFTTNNISVKSFFYTQDMMCFNCSDGLYTTLNGFEIAGCIDDKSKGAGVDENGNLISVELNDDIVSLFLKNYQNIIKQLVNGCNLSLKSGKNELMIYKTGGKGLIILKYRQKYIGV